MKIKIFTSSESPEFAVRKANRFIRNLYEKGFEAMQVKIVRQMIFGMDMVNIH